MSALEVVSVPEVTLLLLGYLVVVGAKTLPGEAALLGYVTGFYLLALVPLLILSPSDRPSNRPVSD